MTSKRTQRHWQRHNSLSFTLLVVTSTVPCVCHVLFLRCTTLSNGVPLKSGLRVTHHANLCTNCTLLKSSDRGYRLSADSMGQLSFISTQRAHEKLYRARWGVVVVQCHSEASKLVSLPIESP